jgi:hypothetical protein
MSRQIYDDRCAVGAHGTMKSDWKDAQVGPMGSAPRSCLLYAKPKSAFSHEKDLQSADVFFTKHLTMPVI